MKQILITGASGNLGQVLVHHLHHQEYDILATFASQHSATLFNHLPNVHARVVDVLDEHAVATWLAGEPLTRLQAAVLLVGGFGMGSFAETSVAQIHKLIQVNFVSAFTIVKALLPHFEQQGGGQFVLIGARPTLNPSDGQHMVAYSLSKALIMNLAELINAYGKAHNITATVLVPSVIDTADNRKAMPDADPQTWVSPDNLAELIGFVLNDTGQMMRETVIKLYNQA